MPMNICSHYDYFSNTCTENICSIYSSENISCHPGYLSTTTKGIATTLLGYSDTSYHSFTSLLVMISITNPGDVMPPKRPTCFPNLTKEILCQKGGVGVPWWFSVFLFKNSISVVCNKRCAIFRICSLPKNKQFLILLAFSNIPLNCAWSFIIT